MRFIDLTCPSRELEPVFAEVADEMLDRIDRGHSSVEACRSTLEDFRALLLTAPRTEVPVQVVIGLIGELVLLNRLLDMDPRAWRSWRGPLGERHDFRTGDHAVEVKSSARTGHMHVGISAVDQLLPPTGAGTLHLMHFALEPVEAGSLSVGQLAASVIAKSGQFEEMVSRLSALGCQDPQDPDWNRHRFHLERETLYIVDGRFPRIIPETFGPGGVPAGIMGVTYQVDLATAADNLVPSGKWAGILTRLVEVP